MTFNPDVLDEVTRAAYDKALTVELDDHAWVGAAASAISAIAEGRWPAVESEAAIDILHKTMPESVKFAALAYDLGLL